MTLAVLPQPCLSGSIGSTTLGLVSHGQAGGGGCAIHDAFALPHHPHPWDFSHLHGNMWCFSPPFNDGCILGFECEGHVDGQLRYLMPVQNVLESSKLGYCKLMQYEATEVFCCACSKGAALQYCGDRRHLLSHQVWLLPDWLWIDDLAAGAVDSLSSGRTYSIWST